MSPVLHLDLIALAADAPADARDTLVANAAPLAALPSVTSAGAILGERGSDYDLAFSFALGEFIDLEAFGTHPLYAEYLQRTVAPVLRSLTSADVHLDGDFGEIGAAGACLVLAAPDETFDWQIRDALGGWLGSAPALRSSVVGLAVGERQRYRGLSLAFGADVSTVRAPELIEYGLVYLRGPARRLA